MPRPSRPLLSFSQSIYLLITLFQAYTYLGLTLIRIKDALPGRTHLSSSSSSSSANRRRRGAGAGGRSQLHYQDHDHILAAAQAARLTPEQLRHVLALHHDDTDSEDDSRDTTTDSTRSFRGHAHALHAYHTFLHYQRTAGLQPQLTARLPTELIHKILIHAGVPVKRKVRSPYELAASPVVILSLNRSVHAALLPRIYHSLIIDRPTLFRSIRITLSQHLTLASSDKEIQLPAPGVHIRTLHIGSALFGSASNFADLMNSDDEEDDDGNNNEHNDNGNAIFDHRRQRGRNGHSRARSANTDDTTADSDDEEGYLPSHLASPSVLSRGIEQILLDAPHLHTLSLDLYAVTALFSGHPRRFASPRAPRPKVLRCELAIPQSLGLKLFRDVQAVELLCFGIDQGSALELCAALPKGVTEITLRFVRRRRTYAPQGTDNRTTAGSAASRARQLATRSFFGLVGRLSSDEQEEDEGQEEEEEADDFHSAHEAEEAVRNLAAAVRVLQYSGRSPASFASPARMTSAYSSSSPVPGGSPASHYVHLPRLGVDASGGGLGVGVGNGSPSVTPRNAHAVLTGSPARQTSALPLAPTTPHATPPTYTASLFSSSPSSVPAPSSMRAQRVSEFFHPDAVPPPNSVIRLHSMDSMGSSSSWSSSEEEEDLELEEGEIEEGDTDAGTADSGGSLGLLGTGVRRVSEDGGMAPRIEEEESEGDEEDVSVGSSTMPMPIPIPRATRRPAEGSFWSGEGTGAGGPIQRSPTSRRTPLQSQVFPSSPHSHTYSHSPTTPRQQRAELPRAGCGMALPPTAGTFSSSAMVPSSAENTNTNNNASGANNLPPELTLTHIRVLAWPGALWRLRQLLPDAQRIVDEPSGALVVSAGNGGGSTTTSKMTKGKGKAKATPSPSPRTHPIPLGTSSSPGGGGGGGAGVPPLAFGPFPASLGLGLDSVHARGPRRGVQELWSRWARQQAGGCAI
ncbi:unnamed protein product [Tilletia laevis]|uniref:Uncharacterized protein n=2 Tax=Tilletia TaxID=13289 RepID=A0A177VBV7_9BASI|nr:hypothetical protein CF336_g406 [Tilletia laevis]KAE8262588.1 hypothetical protein A4X03_0g2340 [Tilletia caries]KAE8205867.1 hypothetical protein CF335_g2160 [Tilletia laevis]CAD6890563.1 unnamed protein product [Tilletia caries]CAD6898607.1 unnamed protein product [Tilletia caries]